MNVDFDEYGNRLKQSDAEKYLNFYPKLGVIETLKSRLKLLPMSLAF